MNRNEIFGIVFIALAFLILKYYPTSARVADHIRFAFVGLSLFAGAFFIGRNK